MTDRDTPPPSWYEPPDPPAFSYTDAWNDARRIDEQIGDLFEAAEEAELDPYLVSRLDLLMVMSDSVLTWLRLKILEKKR